MGGPGRSWRKLHWFDWRRLVGVFINPQLLSGNNLVRISARLKRLQNAVSVRYNLFIFLSIVGCILWEMAMPISVSYDWTEYNFNGES